ncbi:MAG: S46 family peptidase, partial [Bacteroidota bacterium]
MIVTKDYKDIRLVGAPPSAVGKFGGDTDNWVWPRHTGDFSLFRIYANKDNEPAEYSADNVPYQAPRHLEINMNGVKEGDFTMVFGFPGRTEQHLVKKEVQEVIEVINPMRLDMRSTSLRIIDNAMESSDQLRIQYAAKQSRISNAYKKWIGQNKGLIELNVLQKKADEEEAYIKLSEAKGKSENVAALSKINELVEANKKYAQERALFIEYFYYGPEIIRFASAFENVLENETGLKEKGKWEESLKGLESYAEGYFKNYDVAVDQELFAAMTGKYLDYSHMAANYPASSSVNALLKDAKKLSKAFDKSAFSSKAGVMGMIRGLQQKGSKKWAKVAAKDPFYQFAKVVNDAYWNDTRDVYTQNRSTIDEKMTLYVAQKMELFPNRTFWSDANSTLRLTFGKAEGSAPVDGMQYNTFTTSKGILRKYIPGDKDFDLP